MNALLNQANSLLMRGGFDYALCGGWAIDLFVGRVTRVHSDIDICAHPKDRRAISAFMQANGWRVYEMRGQGVVRPMERAVADERSRTLMCVREGVSIVRFFPIEGGGGDLLHEFLPTGITALNYVEFLFNKTDAGDFLYEGDRRIRRPMDRAMLKRGHIPFLAPELALIYKAKDAHQPQNRHDYRVAAPQMGEEALSWLRQSLRVLYPGGHIWCG